VRQETGLDISPGEFYSRRGFTVFGEEDERRVEIFSATYSGSSSPRSSTELDEVQWYPEGELPFDKMPKDYKYWLTVVMAGYAISGYLLEGKQGEIVDGRIDYGDFNTPLRTVPLDI
jgi:hypothetical protein